MSPELSGCVSHLRGPARPATTNPIVRAVAKRLTGMPRIVRGRRVEGFAIPAAVFVIVVVSLLALSGLYMAQSNYQATAAISNGWRALYAADAGATRVLAAWNRPAYNALGPGDSLASGWRTLVDGSGYRTSVLRVDDGGNDTLRLYRLRTIGRPNGAATAQRTLVTLVGGFRIDSVCCEGALKIRGRLTVQGTGNIEKADGLDDPPGAWAGSCGGTPSDLPGILIADSDDLEENGNPEITGAPPVEEDASIDDSDFDVYDELVAIADKRYQGDQHLSSLAPSTSGGECVTTSPSNWGDPLVPGSACWDYLPIIHVAGDLSLSGGNYGQGILLVDGDLDVSGTFDFFGVIIVLGEADFGGTPRIYGGALVRNGPDGDGTSYLRGNEGIHYSSCAVSRALSQAMAIGPLDGRYWFEILQ